MADSVLGCADNIDAIFREYWKIRTTLPRDFHMLINMAYRSMRASGCEFSTSSDGSVAFRDTIFRLLRLRWPLDDTLLFAHGHRRAILLATHAIPPPAMRASATHRHRRPYAEQNFYRRIAIIAILNSSLTVCAEDDVIIYIMRRIMSLPLLLAKHYFEEDYDIEHEKHTFHGIAALELV